MHEKLVRKAIIKKYIFPFSGFTQEAQFTVTGRGALKLVDNRGYTYFKAVKAASSNKSPILHWRCSLKKDNRYICRAKAKTIKVGGNIRVKFVDEHFHRPGERVPKDEPLQAKPPMERLHFNPFAGGHFLAGTSGFDEHTIKKEPEELLEEILP